MQTYVNLAMLQTPTGMTDSQVHWLIAFTACTAIAVLVEALALGAIAVVVVKLINQVLKLTAELKPKVYPMIDSARDLVTQTAPKVRDLVNDTVPKVKRVTTNIADTSDVYRAKVAQVDAFITDTTEKAKRQSDRVDGMVTEGLTSAGQVAGNIQNAVMTPVRQVGGIITSLRANIERFTQKSVAATAAAQAAASELYRQEAKGSRVRSAGAGTSRTPKPVAFEGESVYTGLEDDYHA